MAFGSANFGYPTYSLVITAADAGRRQATLDPTKCARLRCLSTRRRAWPDASAGQELQAFGRFASIVGGSSRQAREEELEWRNDAE
jgi:hypothetical protein